VELRKDLHALAAAQGVDLASALNSLRALYADVDARNDRNTATLELPCKSGCSSCCEESVLLTRLEFYGLWDYVQTHWDDDTINTIISDALSIYERYKDVIQALERPPPEGYPDHSHLLMDVKFRCPILDDAGACRAYPMREIKGRLFGCSFNDDNGVYGCHLVGAHLADKLVTLVKARPMASRVHAIALGTKQQIYPFYVHELYGS
jgi:hypothetical protein